MLIAERSVTCDVPSRTASPLFLLIARGPKMHEHGRVTDKEPMLSVWLPGLQPHS